MKKKTIYKIKFQMISKLLRVKRKMQYKFRRKVIIPIKLRKRVLIGAKSFVATRNRFYTKVFCMGSQSSFQ